MTKASLAAIVARMGWLWFILYALGAAVALYILAIAAVIIIAAFRGLPDDRGRVRYVSGETIVLPPEPEPERPRKRWQITIERV